MGESQPTAGSAWLYGKLSGDETLAGLVGSRIYEDVAPPKAAYPLIVYHVQDGHDVNGVAGARILTQEVYVVKAVHRDTSYSSLKAIAKRIDELIHTASGQTTDGDLVACIREQPLKFLAIEDGVEYRHLGGIYRLWII